MNPLQNLKQSFYKNVIIYNKKFTFDIYCILKNISNKIQVLSHSLKKINDIDIIDIDEIKNDIEKGVEKYTAIYNEIQTWDEQLIDLLFNKYLELISNKDKINFDDNLQLRLYWKIRKYFSKEEVDNWSEIEWNWAVYNLYKDDEDLDKFDDRKIEKRKPWYNLDLFNYIYKQERNKNKLLQEQKQLSEKLIKNMNPDLKDLDIEIIEAEQEDIPTIIEE